jgi:protein tyrosine phosphatase (PTP) superfamily phosphohydrolase (DUF442 family)
MNTIFWIKNDSKCRLAIVARPPGFDWLEEDLKRLHMSGIETLVSLLEPEEERELGLAEEESVARALGMDFVRFPIEDCQLARDGNSFRHLMAELADRARSGSAVGAHCRVSIGRATVATGCILIHLGIAPTDALAMITESRGCAVPDTEEQRQWILNYRAGA